MLEKENPVPLAGGNRAGTLQARYAVDNRETLRDQAQLVDELGRHHGLGDDLDRRLEAYAGLDPGLLAALGVDRFPAAPLRLVGSAT